MRKFTGIILERTPNNYAIKVLRRGKCIDWVTYQQADEMVCWFNCLDFMKFNKRITEQGKRYFRKEIVNRVYYWKQEDAFMIRMQERFRNTRFISDLN